MAEHRSIVGTYDDENTANGIIDELKEHGFAARHIEKLGARGDGTTTERLLEWGLPDADAQSYTSEVDNGRTLVILDAMEDQVSEAVEIMRQDEPMPSAMKTEGEPSPMEGEALAREEEASARVPVVEEELHVGKERVATGGVRVVHRTSERPVSEDIELREEHVQVERHATDRPLTSEDEHALRSGDIEMVESEERPVIAKEARVVEDVEIAKTDVAHTEHIEDTVRRDDVDIEHLEGIESKDRPEARP